jgi:hypothetical protein
MNKGMTMRTMNWLLPCLMLIGACEDDSGSRDDADDGTTSAMTTTMDGSTTEMDGSGTSTSTSSMTATTTSSTTSMDTGDTGSGSTGMADLSCEEYCGIYTDACADFSEYANEQDCMDNCAQWPVGSADDTAHDSLGCRLYHVTVASSTDANIHCPHAGPSGADTCVSADAPECDLYCTRYFENCTDDLNAYTDMNDCMQQCSSWYPGTVDDVDGHTIGCHSYHANAAAGDAPLHCPHAGPGGGGVCVL